MVDRDLVMAKVETLERSLARIDTARTRAGLDALDRQDIIVLNLQRAVQAMLDLAAHVVAREGLGVTQGREEKRAARQRAACWGPPRMDLFEEQTIICSSLTVD